MSKTKAVKKRPARRPKLPTLPKAAGKLKLPEKPEQKKGNGKREVAAGAVVIYVILSFYMTHLMHVRMEHPGVALPQLLSLSMKDCFTHPFQIFPLAPGTLPATFITLLVVTLFAVLIYLEFKVKEHYNPKTVQGDAKWLTNLREYNKKFTEPFGSVSHDGRNNMIMSQDIFMSMDNKRIRRNMNVFVIGGSGAGKSFNLAGPNIMQANCSYIITDPSGGLFKEYGSFLEYNGYVVKCFNLTHMEKGNHYNPFNYIHNDKDIEVLVTTLISNTTPPDKQGGDPFWEKSETALLIALIAYLFHYTSKNCQNFSNVMRLMRAADINENDSTTKSPLDFIFEEVEKYDAESFAVKQYKTFKMGAGKTLKSILISCAVRLQAFDLKDVAALTDTDDIDLDSVGDEKTALFIIIPTGDKTFNFLAAMMYSQLFQRMYDYCENTAEFSQLIVDGEKQLVKTFRAESPEQSEAKYLEACEYFERAKNAKVVQNPVFGWYELRTDQNELVTYRGSREEAEKALRLLQDGQVLPNNKQSNHGQRLPIHTRMLLDEFANIGKIPEFDTKVATIRKYEISTTIILQSLAQMQKMYKDDWSDIAGNCDTSIYLGGGADTVTTKWVSELLGKETRVVMNASYGKGGGSTSFNRQGVELYSPAQLRTMPEDECIVIPKSLDAYKGKKYKSLDHPNRKLVESLDTYYYNPDKIREYKGNPDEEEVTTEQPDEEHGEVVPEQPQEEAARLEEDAEAAQQADEIAKNRDAEGEAVIQEPKSIEEAELDLDVSEPPGELPVERYMSEDASEDIAERQSSMTDINSEEWGIEEMIFSSAPADSVS